MNTANKSPFVKGVTLVELMVVVAIMGILLGIAVPNYRTHLLRVHRSEAIGLLLQVSMCQQRVRAIEGQYDTGQCLSGASPRHYRLDYDPPNSQSRHYLARAIPVGAQRSDSCGNLTMDQNGTRGISAGNASVVKCWSGR